MKKKSKFVSIILNCYNGEKFLFEALKSVTCQTYKNWELIFGTTSQPIIVRKFLKNLKIQILNTFFLKNILHFTVLEI